MFLVLLVNRFVFCLATELFASLSSTSLCQLTVGGLGFPVLFGMWPAAVIHALFVILTRK